MVPQVRPPATDGAADPRMSTSPPPGGSSGPWTTRAPTTGAAPRDLLLRPRAFIQPTLGTKHLQGRVSDLPTRFGSFVLLERRRRLLPGAGTATAAPAHRGPVAAPARPGDRPLRPAPRAVPRGSRSGADAPRLLGGVEHIEAVLQRRFPVLLPLLLHRSDPGLQARSRIRQDVRERRKVLQRPRPSRPRAIVGLLAQEPDHARRLNAHQHRATVEEDLIEAADQHQRLTSRIEVLQDPPRRDPGGFDPAVQRGSTGACLHAHDQRQQDEDLIEAQAHGRGRDSELVLLVRGKLDGLSQPFPEGAFS